MTQAEVGLVRCEGYAADVVRRAMAECLGCFGGVGALVRPGQRVLLKPNLLAAAPPESGVDTHPAIIRAVAELVLEAGGQVSIGDSPAFAPLDAVCEASGVALVARDLGVPIVAFTNPAWVRNKVPAGPCRGFVVDRAVLDADVLINLPKLKSHRQLCFTGAAKNLYGCMPGKRKAWRHAQMRGDANFAAYQACFAATVAPAFNLVDAVVAMHRDGPKGGDLLSMNLLFAGRDPFAVDTLISRIIRVPEADNLIVNAARRLGLGVTDPERIAVLGVDPASLPPIPFRHPMLLGVSFSLPRMVRSAWRSFLISRLGLAERV